MPSADTIISAEEVQTDRTQPARAAVQARTDSDARGDTARRGPFRPDLWLNTRQRNAARLRVFYFRGLDIAGVFLATVASIAYQVGGNPLNASVMQATPFVLGALTVLGLMRSLSLYRFGRGSGLAYHLTSVTCVVAVASAVMLFADLAVSQGQPTRPADLIWCPAVLGILLVSHAMWSLLVSDWRRKGTLTPNVAVVGATRHAENLILEALERRDINVLGVFDDRLARSPDAVIGVPVLGGANALMNHRLTPYIDRIVLAIDPKAEVRVRDLTARLSILPIPLTLLVDADSAEQRNQTLQKLAQSPMAPLEGPIDRDRRAFHKRLQDLVLGALALILLLPLLALIGLMVRLDSPGPALFRQRRHGFNQEEITVWKFRTMRQETADATATRQVTADDDRITRIGRFLRSTSLDELPQLVNVIRGEMSLVGPRPHAIGMKTGNEESARLVRDYAHRHRIKPGMTGWAAIKGSRGPMHTAPEVHRRVQLDIDYIERQSFWLDLWIMLVTVPVLLGDRMAVR